MEHQIRNRGHGRYFLLEVERGGQRVNNPMVGIYVRVQEDIWGWAEDGRGGLGKQ